MTNGFSVYVSQSAGLWLSDLRKIAADAVNFGHERTNHYTPASVGGPLADGYSLTKSVGYQHVNQRLSSVVEIGVTNATVE